MIDGAKDVGQLEILQNTFVKYANREFADIAKIFMAQSERAGQILDAVKKSQEAKDLYESNAKEKKHVTIEVVVDETMYNTPHSVTRTSASPDAPDTNFIYIPRKKNGKTN